MGRYRRAIPAIIGWVLVGLPVVALMLRFGMRAVGVRSDVSLPSFVYWATAWVVAPFYRYFPADARFDKGVVEVAALAAAGAVFLAAVGIYLIGFLLATALRRRA